MNHQSASEDVYPLPDEPPVTVPATVVTGTIETLQRFEEFFRRHASAAVHAELRTFCAALGWHGVCGAEALLDDLGWDAYALRHALSSADGSGPHPHVDQP